MRSPSVVVFVGLMCGTMICAPKPALADIDSKLAAEQVATAALDRFRAKDYATAARLFLEAHELSKSIGPLWNAAKAFHAAHMLTEAKQTWERFLSLSGSTEKEREEARRYLKEIRKQIQAIVEAEASDSTSSGEPETSTTTVDLALNKSQPKDLPKNLVVTVTPKDDGAWWLIGGGGVLAVSAGALWFVADQQLAALDEKLTLNSQGQVDQISSGQAEADQNALNQLRRVSFGLAIGAVVAASAGGWWLSLDTAPPPPVVSVSSEAVSVAWMTRF
jgi:hypothetical protein